MHLSRRESQIMDILYRLGAGGVAEVLDELEDPPSYNSVRVILGILEDKGYLGHSRRANRYIYRPRVSRKQAARSAAAHLLRTFFKGSAPQAVAALLDLEEARLSRDELDELTELIEQAKSRSPE